MPVNSPIYSDVLWSLFDVSFQPHRSCHGRSYVYQGPYSFNQRHKSSLEILRDTSRSMLSTRFLREKDEAEAIVLESLNIWLESVRFGYEVQSVISMRQVLLAQGGTQATLEAHRMIAEKLDAFADVEAAIAKALAHGEDLMVAAERVYAPVRRRVRANNRRLLRTLGSEMKEAAN